MDAIFDFLDKGGYILRIIIGLSVVVFTLVVERLIFFYKIREKYDFLSILKEGKEKELKEALRSKTPLSRLLHNCLINRHLAGQKQKEELELFIMKEEPRFLRFLNFIAVSTTAAPILGLLGTVVGMIKVFDALSTLGSPDAQLLAKGISEALITTEAGLVVALPCLFLHSFLVSKAEGYISKMRHEGLRIISLFENESKKT
ncbi:TPA: hypothetical protein DCX16_01485 [bacterium]|nr:hypothetical protein [bacterium]